MSFIPFINNIAFFLGALSAILGIIAIVQNRRKGHKSGHSLAIAGTLLGIAAIIITLVAQYMFSSALDKVAQNLDDATKSVTSEAQSVVLSATATGNGNVSWGSGGSMNSVDFSKEWSKELTGDDAKKDYSLTVSGDVMADDENQTITCTITVDGKQVAHEEASGVSGIASCDTYFVSASEEASTK